MDFKIRHHSNQLKRVPFRPNCVSLHHKRFNYGSIILQIADNTKLCYERNLPKIKKLLKLQELFSSLEYKRQLNKFNIQTICL